MSTSCPSNDEKFWYSTHLRRLGANTVEEYLPVQEIGHHPTIFVLVCIFVRDTANANNLGTIGEVGRTVLEIYFSYGFPEIHCAEGKAN